MTTTENLHYTELNTNLKYHLENLDTYTFRSNFYISYLLHTITDEGSMCGRFKNTYKVTARLGGANDTSATTNSIYLYPDNATVDLDNTNMSTLTEDAVIDLFDEILNPNN